jgi:hypothetical protein
MKKILLLMLRSALVFTVRTQEFQTGMITDGEFYLKRTQ